MGFVPICASMFYSHCRYVVWTTVFKLNILFHKTKHNVFLSMPKQSDPMPRLEVRFTEIWYYARKYCCLPCRYLLFLQVPIVPICFLIIYVPFIFHKCLCPAVHQILNNCLFPLNKESFLSKTICNGVMCNLLSKKSFVKQLNSPTNLGWVGIWGLITELVMGWERVG